VSVVRQLPVDLLDADWRREARSPRLCRGFAAWRAAEPALARFADVVSLQRFLRNPTSAAESDAVLCALLARARQEPLAARVVLQMIAPGLKRLAGHMLTNAYERDELWSALLAAAWEQIRRYPLKRRRRRVAANLLLDAMHAALAEIARRHPNGSELAAASSLQSAREVCASERDVDALLACAVRGGAVSDQEAEVILESRIDGVSLAEIACAQGVSYNTMKLRRQRAERRLLAFLGYAPVPRGQQKRPSFTARIGRG
jgi:DNA-directed RNA polymerase specialized sigma24 family protein